jgi:hypothetical protein
LLEAALLLQLQAVELEAALLAVHPPDFDQTPTETEGKGKWLPKHFNR